MELIKQSDNSYSCKVMDMIDYKGEIKSLKLQLHENMYFKAGQYINFILPNGESRPLSIANSPNKDNLLELHIKNVKDGELSDYVFNQIKIDDPVHIDGPYGQTKFNYVESDALLFVCGGTGLAPVKSMIEYIFEHKNDEFKPIYLYWGVHSENELYMDSFLKSWAFKYKNFKYIPVVYKKHTNDLMVNKQGNVHEVVLRDLDDLSGFDIYICGPRNFIDVAKKDFKLRNVKDSQIFHD